MYYINNNFKQRKRFWWNPKSTTNNDTVIGLACQLLFQHIDRSIIW